MEEITDLVVAPPVSAPTIKPSTPRAIIMAEALKEDTEQRAILAQYVAKHMKPGTDFGVIPGTEKPTLLKPGAEKLTDLYRCTPKYDITNKIEDWDKGLFHYEFRVQIVSRDADTVLAEGYGSANSREGRYRWRNESRKCPECGKEAICKSKFPPRNAPKNPPGWYCSDKRGGCGANFAHDDQKIVGQVMGKVENDDVYTLVNTILKMAKKRSLVDGAIALARCSDIFTQDVEDFMDGSQIEPLKTSQPPRETKPRKDNKTKASKSAQNEPTKTELMLLWSEVHDRLGDARAKVAWVEAAKSICGGRESKEWTHEEVEKIRAFLLPSEPPEDIPGWNAGDDASEPPEPGSEG
jgi:hypothetical protein